MQAARRLAAPPRQRRFYAHAEALSVEGGYALHLDGKRAVTPGRRPLVVPERRLGDAIVAEWAGQGETIDPLSMPVTRLANSAIDGVAGRAEDVRREVLAYAGADLLYYRADGPEGLVECQQRFWNPLIAVTEARYGVRFVLSEGVTHVAQPASTLDALADAIGHFDEPFRLAGLSLATTLTGSALIALLLAEGEIEADAAWAAAHVDEDWNVSQWGEDAEAAARRRQRLADFRSAALMLGR